ncbi:hypothetical protein [Gorillibacterium sp. CAU 1737]|uniref:hypothetical protein n=1 Tax=Gorillibacterium sp. CAU 1737 TaxID=3140362 RepID=UPI0032610770
MIAQGITDDGCKHDYDVFFGYEDDFSKCSLHPSDNAPNDENGANSLEHRFIIYCDALTQINLRGQILPYYKQLVNLYPEWAQELNTAIAAWSECANYGGYLWSQGFSFDDEGFEKFRSPHMRKILADEGRRAMKWDIEAIEQMERILQKENR